MDQRDRVETELAHCSTLLTCTSALNLLWALRFQQDRVGAALRAEADRLGARETDATRAELLTLDFMLRSQACLTSMCDELVQARRKWVWQKLIAFDEDLDQSRLQLGQRRFDDVTRGCTFPGCVGDCSAFSRNCTKLLQVLFVSQMIRSWSRSNTTFYAQMLLRDESILGSLPYDEDFQVLRTYFESKMDDCAGRRACRRALYSLTVGFLERQIAEAKAVMAWLLSPIALKDPVAIQFSAFVPSFNPGIGPFIRQMTGRALAQAMQVVSSWADITPSH
jgi:hypothetical protein